MAGKFISTIANGLCVCTRGLLNFVGNYYNMYYNDNIHTYILKIQ